MARRWMWMAVCVGPLCLPCACGTAGQREAQNGSNPASSGTDASSADSEQASSDPLVTIARYTGAKQVKAGELVRGLGFTPKMAEDAWNNLPAVQQIEMAYRWAEAFDPDRGGQFFLAALARDMAPHYEEAKNEPALARLFKLATLLGDFQFKEPAGAQAQAPLPDEVRRVIRLLAEYVSRSALGSQHHILVKYFNLPNEEAFTLLAGGQSYGQVLAAALAKVDAARQDDTLRSLAARVAMSYEKARGEPSLKPLLEGFSPAGGAPPEPAAGPSTGANAPESAGIVRIDNPGNVAFDFYLNRKLMGRIKASSGTSFSVEPGNHAIQWRETERYSEFSDPQTLHVTAGNVHTLKAPTITIETCTQNCSSGTCTWDCPPGLTPPKN